MKYIKHRGSIKYKKILFFRAPVSFFTCPQYPFSDYVHTADDYVSKNLIVLIFCESTRSHLNNIVSNVEVKVGHFGQNYCDI